MAICKEVECCPVDPYAYQSVSATDSEAGTRANCVQVPVTIAPVSGSYLFFPSYVVLTVDNDDATIRYTLDGTDPTSSSTLYTAPFQISQAGILLKARAFLTGCDPGPITAALYQNPPFPIGFDYSCVTPDKGGTWGVFAPNGRIDNFWQLQFTLTGNQAIKRLEMRQLSSAGAWNTGVIYSTNSPLTIDGESFAVMPLLLFIAAAQQHTSYQASLGTFGAGTHTWDLYGDKNFSSDGGFWQLDMILGDDTRISSIRTTNCSNSVNPVPCPSPAAPTITPKCDGKVDVVFANSAPQNYKIYVGTTLAASGTTAANPQTVEITGLTPGTLYHFRVELEYAGCGYQSSIPMPGVPKADPVVTITSDKLTVDPNESFTISWTSSNIGGTTCGGCADGQVAINQGLGCKSGNAAGSQATSQAAAGVYTYEITGCNTCETITASVQVTVRDLAICSGPQPSIITVQNVLTLFCGQVSGCGGGGSIGLDSVAWNGQIPKNPIEFCAWIWADCDAPWVGMCSSTSAGLGCFVDGIGYYSLWTFTVRFHVDRWIMSIVLRSFQGSPVWNGEKLYGSTPVGVYTRTSGCATTPTITVA